MLDDLGRAGTAQGGLFDTVDRDKAARLMSVLDDVNARLGDGTLRLAASGLGRS